MTGSSALSCDVRDPAAVAALVDAGAERFGGLDGLVNNAGQSRMKARAEATLDDWRDELDLKFAGVLNSVEAALPLLRRSDAAAIVNMSAVLARQPEPRLVTTSAARAGLLNLSKSLAHRTCARRHPGQLGVARPGRHRPVAAPLRAESGTNTSFAEWEAEIAADRGIGLGRFGHAEEVAAMIVTLLSPRASYVTGTSLDVCGGVARYV